MGKIFPYAYIHKDGCKGPSFFTERIPVSGEKVDCKEFYHLDGTEVTPGEMALCGTCGLLLWPCYYHGEGPQLDFFERNNIPVTDET